MGHCRRVCALLLTILCVSAVLGGSVGTVAADESPPMGAAQLGDAGIEPDGVLLRVDVQADGDARWTIQYRIRLNDDNTTAAFESLREDIDTNESAYTETFRQRMAATAQSAENVTGRSMGVENVSVQTSRQQLPQEYGVVTYGFEWVGFAEVADGELRAGDALAGLFLDRQTTLVISWPDGYGVTAVDPSPDERRDAAVVWVGPTDFGPNQPSVTAAEGASGGSSGGGGDRSDSNGGIGVGTSVLALLGIVALVVVRRRRSGDSAATESGSAGGDTTTAGSTDDAPDTTETEATDSGAAQSTPSEASAGAAASADDEDAPASDDGDADDGDGVTEAGDDADGVPWDDELLSNEERVAVLLEHNDGRMKQQDIASELEWSDAKTSQVIGKMRDEEDVETFRLGRENVVSLPDSRLT